MGELDPSLGKLSDGYHTFGELYRHRSVLFVTLMMAVPDLSWYSAKHSDGTMFDGMFICGMSLPTGQITYHFELADFWDLMTRSGIDQLEYAPDYDGHSSDDVLDRLLKWHGLGKGQW